MGTPPAKRKIPLHEPVFAGNEWKYVKKCLDTGWVSSAGAFVDQFERMTAERLGVKHAVAVVNGTAALHLAFKAVGVRPGDEVLVPALTFIATANAAVYAGAVPRFADSEESTLGIDPDALDEYLQRDAERLPGGGCRSRATGRRIAACVPMHVFGQPVRIARLLEVCARRGIAVVEDAAESLGSFYQGKPAGSFGDVSCLSFNGNKTLTTGGGGMVLTNDDSLAAHVRHLSTQAKKNAATYLHDEVGYNYRLPNLNAALGCAQMERLDALLAQKRRVAGWYRDALAASKRVSLVWEAPGSRSNFWLNTVRASSRSLAQTLMARLNDAGFEARPIWTPCHRQPVFEPLTTGGGAPVTDRLWRTCFNIPSSASLTKKDALSVARLIV